MGVEISSEDELRKWLEGKPPKWSQVIALRNALRVLPVVSDPHSWSVGEADRKLTLATQRIVVGLVGVAKDPANNLGKVAIRNAADAIESAINRTLATGAVSAAAFAAADATDTADDIGFAAAAASSVGTAGEAIRVEAVRRSIWGAVSHDCNAILRGQSVSALLASPLWMDQPVGLGAIWARASAWQRTSDDGFEIWRNWYQRKLDGERFEFAGFDEVAEGEFFDRLYAVDSDWWSREPSTVNAEIRGWLAELISSDQTPEGYILDSNRVDFFISYSAANEATAREVAAILDDLGKTYIVQFRDFAQKNFVNAMNDGLAQAERLIALYSPEYVASGHCMAEWSVFYNRDPSSAKRRIVAFKLEDVDLKPLMKSIVYRDLSRLTGTVRQAAIREWIIWEPTPPTRAQVEQVVTATLSPQIVETEDGKLDTQPNPAIDQPEYPAELAEALKALRMVLDVVLEETSNLPRPMQRALGRYDNEFTANGAKSSWGGLERMISIIAGGLPRIPEAELEEGEKEALEQLIAAHGACMAALKNADTQLRELDAIPLDGADQARIKDLVDRLKDFFERLRNLGLTRNRLDRHVDDLVEQGRDFAFEAGEPDAAQRPHARRQYLLYVGGFGLAALNALGSMASISAVPMAQEAISAGQAMVEVFFRMVGL